MHNVIFIVLSIMRNINMKVHNKYKTLQNPV